MNVDAIQNVPRARARGVRVVSARDAREDRRPRKRLAWTCRKRLLRTARAQCAGELRESRLTPSDPQSMRGAANGARRLHRRGV